jgi:hypothetical protein
MRCLDLEWQGERLSAFKPLVEHSPVVLEATDTSLSYIV